MAKEKVCVWLEKELLYDLESKYNTKNQSEAIRMAIMEILARDSSLTKIHTLYSYVGKKPPRIGSVVAEAFQQSECQIFVDLFCGSLAMLCYLPWDVKVVVNDINGELTNLYLVIRDNPSAFVHEVWKLPYSEVLFRQFIEEVDYRKEMSSMERAVRYYYISFAAYRGRLDYPMFDISTYSESNRARKYQTNLDRILSLSKRLQTVEILNRDFRKVLHSFHSAETFVYADCPYLGTEIYYESRFTTKDHEELAMMLKDHGGKFVLSSMAKKELRKLYCSNRHFMLEFEESARLPDKRHREQLIMNFKMEHKNRYGEEDVKPYR